MTAGIKRIALSFLLLGQGLVFGGLVECQWDPISMDRIGDMAIDDFVPQNGYSYSFVNGSRDITDGSDFTAVREAFGTWIQEPGSNLWASEGTGSRSFTPGEMNHQNDISWISATAGDSDPWSNLLQLSNQIIAVVMTWYNTATRQVVERDIYFNDVDMHWRTDSDGEESGGYNVEHIALHEIGHIFGLKDVYNPGEPGWESWMGSGNQGLTMYGYSSWQNNDVTLDEASLAAMALLHPSAVPEAGSVSLFGLAAGILLVTRRR